MNKSELITVVAEKSELKRAQAEKAVNAVFDAISSALVEGEKVQLIGFGTFELRARDERTATNPQKHGEKITIPAHTVPAFKASSSLKESVKDTKVD